MLGATTVLAMDLGAASEGDSGFLESPRFESLSEEATRERNAWGRASNSSPLPRFPEGIRVLVVDDDPVCLRIVQKVLQHCKFEVSTSTSGSQAIELLKADPDRFHIVLSDVHMPDMDGFKLLERIGIEMDIPVIMMSSNGDTSVVYRGITAGAVDYLIKPVRIEELRNIWQHVVRRRHDLLPTDNDVADAADASPRLGATVTLPHVGSATMHGPGGPHGAMYGEGSGRPFMGEQGMPRVRLGLPGAGGSKTGQGDESSSKSRPMRAAALRAAETTSAVVRASKSVTERSLSVSVAQGGSWGHGKPRKGGSVQEAISGGPGTPKDGLRRVKKHRVVWTVEMHQKFVNAVNQLGVDKAVPKRILSLMEVPGLTRENVASHLQKYRLYLKKIQGHSSQGGGQRSKASSVWAAGGEVEGEGVGGSVHSAGLYPSGAPRGGGVGGIPAMGGGGHKGVPPGGPVKYDSQTAPVSGPMVSGAMGMASGGMVSGGRGMVSGAMGMGPYGGLGPLGVGNGMAVDAGSHASPRGHMGGPTSPNKALHGGPSSHALTAPTSRLSYSSRVDGMASRVDVSPHGLSPAPPPASAPVLAAVPHSLVRDSNAETAGFEDSGAMDADSMDVLGLMDPGKLLMDDDLMLPEGKAVDEFIDSLLHGS